MRKHDYKNPLPKWKMLPQECEGKYTFDGKMYLTKGIYYKLTEEELHQIITDIRRFVRENDGADYIFYFQNKNKKIFVIDSIDLDTKIKLGKDLTTEHNYFTVMFAEEY